MAWSPFSFDGFDENLPNLTTDNTIDNGIVTAETLADDDIDSELFKSYQLTKESSNPFAESDEIFDDDMEECSKCKKECGTSKCKNESDEDFDDNFDESVFFSFGEHCGHCDKDDVEECGSKCKKESDEDIDDEEISPFEEANFIMMDITESVLDDGEDDLIADDVDDMIDDDDDEIDADVEGIEEIEADIIDDEEDDLIDMAMDAEE